MKKLITITTLLVLLVGALTGCCIDPNTGGNLVPPTVDEDPLLPALEFNGTKAYYQTHGDPTDPVIVFLHGGPGGNFSAFERMNALADAGYFLVYWDQRGSGLSRRHSKDEYSLKVLVEDLDALINIVTGQSSKQQVTLVGNSWGGQYAALYLLDHPERVSSVVMVEPGPFTGSLLKDKMGEIFHLDLFDGPFNEALWAGEAVQGDTHARADYMMMVGSFTNYQPSFHSDPTDTPSDWRLGAVANNAILALGKKDGEFNFDFTAGIEDFSTKALFIKGAWNEVYDIDYYQEQMKDFPNAELKIVEGVGHDAVWDKAADVRELILAYLTELGV